MQFLGPDGFVKVIVNVNEEFPVLACHPEVSLYKCVMSSADRILKFLRSYTDKHRRPPTVREIQRAVGFKSPRAVSYFLDKLEKARRIVRRGRSRGIFITGASVSRPEPETAACLPFFSAIPAGRADWAEVEPDRQVAMEPGLFGLRSPDRAFVVKVRGRSMEGAGIRDGDLAVLEKKEPREGDVVAALVDGEVTLKRLVTERKGWFLKSENPEYPDLTPRRDLQVQGVLVGLVRRWKS